MANDNEEFIPIPSNRATRRNAVSEVGTPGDGIPPGGARREGSNIAKLEKACKLE